MKLVSIAAIAGMAAAVDEHQSSSSGSQRLDGLTKEKLEQTTRQFVEANLGGGRRLTKQHTSATSGGKQRALRSSSTRKGRISGKGGKWGNGSGDWGGAWSGKSGKGGKWWGGSGKSGKWSGSSSGDWGHEELFYLLPTACPNECISSHVTSDHEMIDSIKKCKEDEETQMWLVKSDGSYIMIESYDEPGMCIAVDYEHGDDNEMLAKTCYNGELFLKDCDSEYGTEWYFTGGQLVNSLCWGTGLSSFMTVFLDDDEKMNTQECLKDVAVWGGNDEAVLKADTFMFVNRLPMAPVHMSHEEVNEELDKKDEKPEQFKQADAEGETR